MSKSHPIPEEFFDAEYLYAYAEDFLNTKIAAQIRVLREQRELTQEELAKRIGTKQPGIARLENVNYAAWKIETLKKLARALGVIFIGGFISLRTFIEEEEKFGRKILEQPSFDDEIAEQEQDNEILPAAASARALAELEQRINTPKHQMKKPGIILAQPEGFSRKPFLPYAFNEKTNPLTATGEGIDLSIRGRDSDRIFWVADATALSNVDPLATQASAQVPITKGPLFTLLNPPVRVTREPMELSSQFN